MPRYAKVMPCNMQPAMPLRVAALPQQLQGVVPRRQVHAAVETWDFRNMLAVSRDLNVCMGMF